MKYDFDGIWVAIKIIANLKWKFKKLYDVIPFEMAALPWGGSTIANLDHRPIVAINVRFVHCYPLIYWQTMVILEWK